MIIGSLYRQAPLLSRLGLLVWDTRFLLRYFHPLPSLGSAASFLRRDRVSLVSPLPAKIVLTLLLTVEYTSWAWDMLGRVTTWIGRFRRASMTETENEYLFAYARLIQTSVVVENGQSTSAVKIAILGALQLNAQEEEGVMERIPSPFVHPLPDISPQMMQASGVKSKSGLAHVLQSRGYVMPQGFGTMSDERKTTHIMAFLNGTPQLLPPKWELDIPSYNLSCDGRKLSLQERVHYERMVRVLKLQGAQRGGDLTEALHWNVDTWARIAYFLGWDVDNHDLIPLRLATCGMWGRDDMPQEFWAMDEKEQQAYVLTRLQGHSSPLITTMWKLIALSVHCLAIASMYAMPIEFLAFQVASGLYCGIVQQAPPLISMDLFARGTRQVQSDWLVSALLPLRTAVAHIAMATKTQGVRSLGTRLWRAYVSC